MKILEPTLIRPSAVLGPNAGGVTDEIEFNFGSQEGALLLAVEYAFNPGNSTTGLVEIGLNFNGTAAAPAASDDLRVNRNVFAQLFIAVLGVTAVGFNVTPTPHVNLQGYDIAIASNVALQAFATGAVARSVSCKIYYKRVFFSFKELGAMVASQR